MPSIDTIYIIKTYSATVEKLVKLGAGTYERKDSYYKMFHRYAEGSDEDLRGLVGREWDIEDIRQEIYCAWHKTISRYYHPARGRRERKKSYSLHHRLWYIGMLHLARVTNTFLNRRKLRLPHEEDSYCPFDTCPEELSLDLSPSALLRSPKFRTTEKLGFTGRLFLYRLLHEDCKLYEMMPEFGKDRRTINKLIEKIKKVMT